MYEELQRKTRPKEPRYILVGDIKKFFGIISPSKLMYERFRPGGNDEVNRYLEENRKYLLYRRREGVKECIQRTYGIIEAVIMTERPIRPL